MSSAVRRKSPVSTAPPTKPGLLPPSVAAALTQLGSQVFCAQPQPLPLPSTHSSGILDREEAYGAVKHDAGKLPLGLVPSELLRAVAAVMGFGANKYGRYNWCKGMDWSRVYDALQRHLLAWWDGEDRDPESGEPHLAHAGCCLAFLLTYQARGSGKDDRPCSA
jgi:hypothetical protein